MTAQAAAVLQALQQPAGTRWTVDPLSLSADGRAVLRYVVAGRPVVVKAYPPERASEGATTYAVQRDVAAALARLDDVARAGLAVPAALAWDGVERLLVMEAVDGTSYRDLARGADAPLHLRRAGAALAVLHALPVPPAVGPPRTLAATARDIARPDPERLAGALPAYATRIGAVWSAVLAAEPAGVAPGLVHRDVHLGQLVARDGGAADEVTLLDWDLAACGDPALDVANLLAYLDTRLGAGPAAAASAAVCEGYAGRGDAAVLDRLAPWTALTYLRMAAKRHRLGPGRGGPLDVAALLARAEAALR